MAETKHNVAAQSCGNCNYWQGQHMIDSTSKIVFINPNESASCSNPESQYSGELVAPSEHCAAWKELVTQ